MIIGRRVVVSLIAGAALGVVCIVGVSIRMETSGLYLLAMWYNRLIMGLVIGLAGGLRLIDGPANRWVRGLLLGLLVALAIFLSTALTNVLSFLAGIVYGPIIEWAATRYGEQSVTGGE